LKELVGKKGEVAEKVQRNYKVVLYWMCIEFFRSLTTDIYIYRTPLFSTWVWNIPEPTSGACRAHLPRCARASAHLPSGSVFILRCAYPVSPHSGCRGFHFFIPRYSFSSPALPVQFHRVGGSVVSVFFFPKCEHKLGRHAVAFFCQHVGRA